jgi:predicted amidohydrolase YtcJ
VLFTGGTIRTLDPAAPTVGRLAVRGPWVVDDDKAGEGVIELGARCVMPGFTDSHVHFPTWSLGLRQARLEGARSLEEALDRVVAARPHVREGGWLRGLGWREGDWPEPPTREALDRAVPDLPVALMSKDYHSLWVNSAALERAEGPLEVPGGVVEESGILRENAAWAFRDRYVRPTLDEMIEASREGMKVAASRGVVAIHDKDGWLGSFEVHERLLRDGELLTRVWQSFPWDRLDELSALGIRSGFGDPMLRFGYLKGFMDGTLGSATARLLDGSGVEISSREVLEDVVRRAAAAGWPVAVHAIGDAANRSALDAFEATRDEWAPRGLRQRIEHAQLLDDADVARFAEIGVTGSVQFSHAPSDRDLAERLWEGKQGAYAYRSLLDAGATLANGSDAPVEELDPLAGIVAGVLRTLDDRPPWRPEQSVTIEEALRATCVTPAWLEHAENRRGTLRPGMAADLVILNRDPVSCPPDELPSLRVEATMVAGRWTHRAG